MNKRLVYLLLVIMVVSGCKKNEELSLMPVSELYPIQTGKAFFYRLDSTIVNPLNKQQLITRSYHAKDSIESEFTDASGRRSFRIYRYLRDTLNQQAWRNAATYNATFDENRIEFVDNNLRFVTLVNPVKEGAQWKGTQFINTGYSSPFNFFSGWNFEYRNTGANYTVRKGVISDTYTVFQQDVTSPDIPFNPANFQTKDYSVEVYAKGIGLIYKEFLHWVYQPNTYFQDESYGIKLSLMDYK